MRLKERKRMESLYVLKFINISYSFIYIDIKYVYIDILKYVFAYIHT